MGKSTLSLLFCGASSFKLCSEGSSTLKLMRSAYCAARKVSCLSALGMPFRWMYPLKLYTLRSLMTVSSMRSIVESGEPSTAEERNSPSI